MIILFRAKCDPYINKNRTCTNIMLDLVFALRMAVTIPNSSPCFFLSFCPSFIFHFASCFTLIFHEWWDVVAEATGLGLFVLLLSSLVCCQPTDLIRALFFCFINYPILLPPPLPLQDGSKPRPSPFNAGLLTSTWSCAAGRRSRRSV